MAENASSVPLGQSGLGVPEIRALMDEGILHCVYESMISSDWSSVKEPSDTERLMKQKGFMVDDLRDFSYAGRNQRRSVFPGCTVSKVASPR
jgi:hypothetical protein